MKTSRKVKAKSSWPPKGAVRTGSVLLIGEDGPVAKPKYTQDCDRCVFLGQVQPRNDGDKIIDVYWCKSNTSPSLDSILGRYGDKGPEYASSHPPSGFAGPQTYLAHAERWYLFALVQAALRGLWIPSLISRKEGS